MSSLTSLSSMWLCDSLVTTGGPQDRGKPGVHRGVEGSPLEEPAVGTAAEPLKGACLVGG